MPPRITKAAIAAHQRRLTQIKAWREYRGYTQDELAEMIGASKSTISRIESAEQPYTQDTLEMIADALKTRPELLLSAEPHKHRRKHQSDDPTRP